MPASTGEATIFPPFSYFTVTVPIPCKEEITEACFAVPSAVRSAGPVNVKSEAAGVFLLTVMPVITAVLPLYVTVTDFSPASENTEVSKLNSAEASAYKTSAVELSL